MDKVKIAIIDSGVKKYHSAWDVQPQGFTYNNGIMHNEFEDEFGHGTAVYNIIRKNTRDSEITNIKLDGINTGVSEDELISVLNYIYNSLDFDIINLSLGINVCERLNDLRMVCGKLDEKGTIIVSAFDNAGAISYPAAIESVIGVTESSRCRNFNEFEYVDDNMVNIAVRNSIQRLAWIGPDYIMMGGNSFSCAYITAYIAECIKKGIRGRRQILEQCRRDALNIITLKKEEVKQRLQFNINRAAVFPFNKEMHSIVRFSEFLSFSIADVYDSKYSGQVGATTKQILKEEREANFEIKNIENIAWNTFDTLILGHTDRLSALTDHHGMKQEIINSAVLHNKNIYALDDVSMFFKDSRLPNNVFFPCIDEKCLPPNRFGKLYRNSKPVLGIFGTSSQQGKFTLQLMLRYALINCGYSVGQIGTEPTALLYGMDYVFPMGYNSTVSVYDNDIVRYLNSAINELSDNDIILVGSQSGTIPYDTGNIILYNIQQYNFLMGCQPDAAILCINSYDDFEYVKRTIGFIESGVDGKVIALVVFPMTLKNFASGVYGGRRTLRSEEFNVLRDKYVKEMRLPVFRLDDEKLMDCLLEIIMDFFS